MGEQRCRKCGYVNPKHTMQRFKDGTEHVRMSCPKCLKFLGYAPKRSVDLATTPSAPNAKSKMFCLKCVVTVFACEGSLCLYCKGLLVPKTGPKVPANDIRNAVMNKRREMEAAGIRGRYAAGANAGNDAVKQTPKKKKSKKRYSLAKEKRKAFNRRMLMLGNPQMGVKPPDPVAEPMSAPGSGVDEWRDDLR